MLVRAAKAALTKRGLGGNEAQNGASLPPEFPPFSSTCGAAIIHHTFHITTKLLSNVPPITTIL